ncbi:hypothetical protein ABPG73_000501 [Tetrahymena malaccensis]
MCVGFLGRNISQKLIKQDIFLLILQNIHQGKYLELLKRNKLLPQENQNQILEVNQKDTQEQEFIQSETVEPIKIPAFLTKSRQSVDQNAQNFFIPSINNFENSQQDEIIESKIQESAIQSNSRQSNSFEQKNQLPVLENLRMLNENMSFSPQQTLQTSLFNSQLKKRESCASIKQPQILVKQSPKSNIIYQNKLTQDENIQNKQFQKYKNKSNKPPLPYLEKFLQGLRQIKNKLFQKRIRNSLFGFRFWKRNEYYKQLELNSYFFKNMQNDVQQNLNIFHLYKQIITLQKALMVILTADQFAAVKLMGCSEKISTLLLNNKKENWSQLIQMSHFEEQFVTQFYEEEEQKQIRNFFLRCENKKNLSELDNRIYHSIIKCYSNQ